MRFSTLSRNGPDAPLRVELPISSWSKQASTCTWPDGSAAASATTPACTLERLSSRADARNSPVTPMIAGGSVTAANRSWPSISSRCSPTLPATAESRSSDAVPNTGFRFTCLSRCRLSLTLRSRCGATWGIRSHAGVETRCTSPERATTRPASPNSRSSQEFSSGPP